MKKYRTGDYIRVEWLDACGQDSESSPGEAKQLSPITVTTLGKLIVCDKEKVNLAASHHVDGDEHYRDSVSIPRRMVLGIFKLVDASSARPPR